MYYDQNQLEEQLKCSFCERIFNSTIKLISKCGHSVCGDCLEYEIQPQIECSESGKFYCKPCEQEHEKPQNGFPDNESLQGILQILRKYEKLSQKEIGLRDMVEELSQAIDRLKDIDSIQEIENSCHSIEYQVIDAVESAINHLREIERKMLKKIDDRRTKLLENRVEPKIIYEPYMNELEKAEEFLKKWREYFTDVTRASNDEEIEIAEQEAEDLKCRIEVVHGLVIDHLTDAKREIRFVKNNQILESKSIVGEIINVGTEICTICKYT